ncbi:MAG: hypothetical protein H3Z54_14430 [archaeon]|nr:hypothetical protein [archaeon]
MNEYKDNLGSYSWVEELDGQKIGRVIYGGLLVLGFLLAILSLFYALSSERVGLNFSELFGILRGFQSILLYGQFTIIGLLGVTALTFAPRIGKLNKNEVDPIVLHPAYILVILLPIVLALMEVSSDLVLVLYNFERAQIVVTSLKLYAIGVILTWATLIAIFLLQLKRAFPFYKIAMKDSNI